MTIQYKEDAASPILCYKDSNFPFPLTPVSLNADFQALRFFVLLVLKTCSEQLLQFFGASADLRICDFTWLQYSQNLINQSQIHFVCWFVQFNVQHILELLLRKTDFWIGAQSLQYHSFFGR